MSRRSRMLALCAGAALLVPGSAAAKPPPSLVPGPDSYPTVAVQHAVPITMPDGVKLFADVFRPANADGSAAAGRFPAVLTQTPYQRNPAGTGGAALGGISKLIVKHGYVAVLVDVRGTGSSEGVWDSFGEKEQHDSLDIISWIRKQPWNDGRLATYGPSYMGINQFLTAAQHPPGLKAMFPVIPASDVYRDVTWHGGALDAGFMPFWLGLVTALGELPPDYMATDPVEGVKVITGHALDPFQVQAVTNIASRSDLAFDGPFYRSRSPETVVGKITIPTFITGGWFDLFQRGEPRLYQGLRLKPGRKQLLMGPWYHITAGDGLGAKGMPPTLEALALAWFDRWVKGKRNHVEDFGPVTLYQLGKDRYARQHSYPRKDVHYERLYLRHEQSGSATSVNDGSLSSGAPTSPASDTVAANLVNGICGRSNAQWTAGLIAGLPCDTDNRLQEVSSLTYTTPAMKGQLHLSGPLSLTLRGSTTAADTTWIAQLTDVAPSGASTQVTAGWLMASRRAVDMKRSTRAVGGDVVVPFHPFTRETLLPVKSGETETLMIEIFGTDAVIAPGHRLRLTISSGDIPHMLATVPDTLAEAGAIATVHEDPAAPSFLTLPVVGSLGSL